MNQIQKKMNIFFHDPRVSWQCHTPLLMYLHNRSVTIPCSLKNIMQFHVYYGRCHFSLLFEKYYALSPLTMERVSFPCYLKKMLSTFTSNIERVTFTCSLKNIMHFYLYYGACHFSLLFEKKYAIYMTSPNNQMLFFCYFNGTAFDNDIEKKISNTQKKKC